MSVDQQLGATSGGPGSHRTTSPSHLAITRSVLTWTAFVFLLPLDFAAAYFIGPTVAGLFRDIRAAETVVASAWLTSVQLILLAVPVVILTAWYRDRARRRSARRHALFLALAVVAILVGLYSYWWIFGLLDAIFGP